MDGGHVIYPVQPLIDVVYTCWRYAKLHAQMANASHQGMIEFENRCSFFLTQEFTLRCTALYDFSVSKQYGRQHHLFAENATIKLVGNISLD